MINYVVADIRIGTPGPRYLPSDRRAFQDKVVRLLLRERRSKRVAHEHSFSYSYSQVDQNAGHIQALLDQALVSSPKASSEKIHALTSRFHLVAAGPSVRHSYRASGGCVYYSRAGSVAFRGPARRQRGNRTAMIYGAAPVLVIWRQHKQVRLENPAGQSRSRSEESGR